MKMTLDINRVITDQEEEILKKIAAALPEMSDLDKGYLLGMAETMIERSEKHDFSKSANER